MTRTGNENPSRVTGEELEHRWRALGPAVQRELGGLLGKLSPGQLVLAGLGLVAAGATCYLTREHGPAGAEPATATPADAPAAPPEPAPRAPRAVGEAVLRGVLEGLVGSGVLPTLGGSPSKDSGKEADAGES